MRRDAAALPIDEALPRIRTALAERNRLVLAAPPGAGKTTRVPIALLDEGWLAGRRILMLEPRRIAARMAAERMAATLGEKVGDSVGLSTRVDRRVSAKTRIEVVTDGLFTRRILSAPDLDGVGAVLFDEFHERSLAADLGLALARDVQGALRDDLRLVLMSATLDVARMASAFEASIVESEGRSFPVETVYLGKSADPIEEQAARAVRRALREQEGSMLVFLPGMREIQRAAERLADLPADIIVAPLYGALSPAEQDRAVAPAPAGKRKVVIATDIAESSLTIEGVNAVIDAGLARVADYDPDGVGATLLTRRASRASVDQRRGRAGRLGPGVCYRLWDEEGTRGLPAEPVPEILAANLDGLVLALAEWGESDAARLPFIDAPPPGRLVAARASLTALGALDVHGALTPRGREMARLPMAPRLAAMIAGARDDGERALAAEIAALIGERGLGGNSSDLRDRIDRFRKDASPRATALKAQARNWAKGAAPAPVRAAGRAIAGALPLSIARAEPNRAGKERSYQLATGRAVFLDAGDALANEKWLAVADSTGAAAGARILAAAPLSEEDALALGGVTTEETAAFDAGRRTVAGRRVTRLGAIELGQTPLPRPAADVARAAILDAIRREGLGLLAHNGAVSGALARLMLIRSHEGEEWPALTVDGLLARAEEWLAPLFGDPPSIDRPGPEDLRRGVFSLLDWRLQREIETLAPASIETPAGRRIAIDYDAEGGPRVEARVQEFYGLAQHPAVLRGKVPLVVSLLSPAGRQVALTKDLPRFWREGYRDMAKDMRGQYPKHDWPEDPAKARAHAGKTKARLSRDG
jgi:ATP-dependent helicase HrpB